MKDKLICNNGVWITWETQRRNKGLSTAVGFKLYVLDYGGRWFSRYVKCCWSTFTILRKERPSVVVAQNPSIILATIVVVFRLLFGFTVAIDAHNSGIFPAEGHSNLLMKWAVWLQRQADFTIVTNDNLKRHVEKNGGLAIVIEDALPEIPGILEHLPLIGSLTVAYICTYASDEPYKEVIQAAKLLPSDVFIYVTGRYDGKVDYTSVPKNIVLMGYLPDTEYWSLLNSVDFIMDLTLREDCLVCGAYEGVAAGKPLLLSDTKALRDYFYKGCIYVLPSSHAIADAVISAKQKQKVLFTEINELRHELPMKWDDNVELFMDMLNIKCTRKRLGL